MKKMIINVLFCTVLAAGLLGEILLPDKAASDIERRSLTRLPDFSLTALKNRKLSDETEKYLADQFPARNLWITAKSTALQLSGQREIGGAYLCDDGYLIAAFQKYSAKRLSSNIQTVGSFAAAMGNSGVPTKVMLIPTAGEILAEKLPFGAPEQSQQSVLASATAAGLDTVDCFGILEDRKGEYIYYKTDHHYTSLGAYYCYCAWKAAKGETPRDISAYTKEILTDGFLGTSYAKVQPLQCEADSITAYYREKNHRVVYNGSQTANSLYERSYLQTADGYGVFLNGNQPSVCIQGQGQGNLLIIKDSFANCFVQFCADEYAQTHLIDLRYFTGSVSSYAEVHDITEILVLYSIPGFCEDVGLMKLS